MRDVAELSVVFLKLGATSFGGPVAHLGYFRDEFVRRRGWMTDDEYAELVAMCQFLPGPASSQVVFAIGLMRAGFLGAVAASFCFLLPSAVMMVAFAYGVTRLGDVSSAGWVHGLKLAAAAVVADAVLSMGRVLCPDWARRGVCAAAAAVVLASPGAAVHMGVIAGGGVLGWILYRRIGQRTATTPGHGRGRGVLALVAFVALLVTLPLAAAWSGNRHVEVFDSFYRAGSLVFGGGHVVLPLLRQEVVGPGWLSDEAFLAGYGAAQAVPGPLFSFAGYLGAMMHGGPHAWIGGVWCLLAVFLPAWLLVGGVLPFWARVRATPWARAAVMGANAAVVGLLLAALHTPILTGSVRGWADAAAVLGAFVSLAVFRAPPWAVVVAMAGLGQWVLGP